RLISSGKNRDISLDGYVPRHRERSAAQNGERERRQDHQAPVCIGVVFVMASKQSGQPPASVPPGAVFPTMKLPTAPTLPVPGSAMLTRPGTMNSASNPPQFPPPAPARAISTAAALGRSSPSSSASPLTLLFSL